MGAPLKFKDEFVTQAEKLCVLGATDEELADFFGVEVRTVYRWKHDHPEFAAALKVGKEVADERVERALYQRATGFRRDAVKIFMPADAEEPVFANYVEDVAPDTTACIFWLKNRRPQDWRDKHDYEHSMADDLAAKLLSARGRIGKTAE